MASNQRQTMPLLSVLHEQKEMHLKGGIYRRVQIDMTYRWPISACPNNHSNY